MKVCVCSLLRLDFVAQLSTVISVKARLYWCVCVCVCVGVDNVLTGNGKSGM